MKKDYLKFSNKPMSFLPKVNSRRFRTEAGFATRAYKTDGGGEGSDSPEAKALIQKIKDQVAEQLGTRASKEELTTLNNEIAKFKDLNIEALREMTKEGEGNIMNILAAQGAEIVKLKTQGVSNETRMSTRERIQKYLTENKEKLEAFRRGDSKVFGVDKNGEADIVLETRAAATMGVSTSSNGSAFAPMPEVVPGLIDLYRNRPFIEQYANNSATNRPRIVYTEKTNPQGNAAFLLEGGVKPLISFEWITRESYAKKVADKIKVSSEAMEDVEWLAAEIEKELKYQVDIKVDVELLTGTGDGTQGTADLKGLTTFVAGYTLTTIKTPSPNNFDAIRASIAQIISLNFNPDVVFINTIDGANMDLTKDAQNRPLKFMYETPDGKLFKLNVVETNQIPQGSFLVADMSKFRIRNYKPFAIYYGWVNDDFEKNLITIIGERRLHAYVYNNEIGAFVYATFAAVKTALT